MFPVRGPIPVNVTGSDPIPIVTYLPDRHKHLKKIRGGDIEKVFEIVLYETISVVSKIYFSLGATYHGM